MRSGSKSLWFRASVMSCVVGLLVSGCSSSSKSSSSSTSAGGGSTVASGPATSVKLILGWVVQPEYAGFFAAKSLGYYKAVGLNVTIQPGGPDVNTEQLVGAGTAPFGTDTYDNVLASNDAGTDLVSLAQLTSRSALRMISLKKNHLTDPSSWKGKTIGVFASDNPLYATFAKYGINPKKDVKLVDQGFDMSGFLSGKLDLASGYTFNEVGQVIQGGIPASQLNLYDFNAGGTATLQDQIFGNGAYVKAHPDVAAKLVAASLKGWAYCRDNPQACVDIVAKAGAAIPKKFSLWQMNEFNQLMWPTANNLGYMDPSAFQKSADILFQNKVIKKAPTISDFMETSIYNQAVGMLSGVDLKGASYKPISGLTP